MNSTTITTGMDTKGTLRGADVSGPTEAESTMNSPKRIARIAGVLYLLVAVFSTFAITFVRGKVYVPGGAAATLGNVVANSGLVRIGVVADLFQATVFVFLGMTLYLLLKHVHKGAASAMVVLVAIATSIMCLDNVFQFAGLRVATDGSYAAALGTHYVTRNRTHRSDFSPFFLRASEIPTIVARCFRLLFWQLLLVIGRVRFLVKPTFFCGWRYACVTEGPPVRLIYWGGTGLHELGAGVHLRRVGMPDESLCPPSPMEIWLYGGRADRYVSTHLTRL